MEWNVRRSVCGNDRSEGKKWRNVNATRLFYRSGNDFCNRLVCVSFVRLHRRRCLRMRNEQKCAGADMSHHSGVSSGLSEGRCAGGGRGVGVEKHLLLRQRAAFWSLLWHRGGFFTESSVSCAPTFSAHSPCLYVPALNRPPFYLKPQIGRQKIAPSFSCFFFSHHEIKNISNPFLRICALLLALSFSSDINKDEFLIGRNKQLSKNVTHRHSESLFLQGLPSKVICAIFCSWFVVVKNPRPSCWSLCSSLVSGDAE